MISMPLMRDSWLKTVVCSLCALFVKKICLIYATGGKTPRKSILLSIKNRYSACRSEVNFVLPNVLQAYIYIEVGAMGKRSYKIREKISNAFELPQDIVLDVSKVIIIGTNQVTIENHKGIIEYSQELIRVNTGSGIMNLCGRNLVIKHIFQEEITITGEIQSINY